MAVKLELYRVFKEVAETGNISVAAKNLYISQSAVSQSVKQLETALQARLFARSPRGVSLTGGVGKISHVVFGVLIIGVLTNGMTMMAVDDYWQRVVKGLVLLLAVGFDRFIQKRQQKSE